VRVIFRTSGSRIVLLTGPIGAGKTTVAERVVGLAKRRGMACRGLLAPAIVDACGHKTGIWGIDLAGDERRALARTDSDLGGPRLGPYSFDAAALDWAAAVVLAALTSPPLAGGTEGGYSNLVIVDEIGKLELWYGLGLAPVLPRLAAGEVARALVVVRDTLVEELQRWMGTVEPVTIRVSEQNREMLPAQILEALLQPDTSRR
jgi:nucleoside-triphosphatase THEP1